MKEFLLGSALVLSIYSSIGVVSLTHPPAKEAKVQVSSVESILKGEERFRKEFMQSKKSSIIQVIVDGVGGTSLGSGSIVSPNGLAITCYHVVDSEKKVTVVLGTGETYEAVVVAVDRDLDMALLQLPKRGTKYNFSKIASRIEEGDTAITFTNPHGIRNSITQGIVSKIDTFGPYSKDSFTLFDALVAPGSSGGGIFNIDGELIGMVDAVFTQGSLMLGVKASDLSKFLNNYLNKHSKVI